ncbi:MAG TPA: helix-turn-helix transcriptional regulator [Ktedonobacterales bacterium]|nr:helix-turn-helix transcriptional regulator [Ktedonobacterales bacterium]
MSDDETSGPNSRKDEAGGPPKNWLVPYLLLMLRDWSSYGFDMLERLQAFGFAAMNPGSLYRILRQMEKDGMVTSAWDTSKAGPARRMYTLTEAGEAYLKVWARSLARYQDMTHAWLRLYGLGPRREKSDEQ